MKTYTLGQSREEVIGLFPERKIKQVLLGEQKVCVVRVGVDFFAFEPYCPHRMMGLREGWVTAYDEVVCPLHQYRFELRTGKVAMGDCRELICYRTSLEEGGLVIFI
ncbi:biphenyl dioxygenase [Lunatimonas lonarensis]|uniref:Biphenyl dioxygenase n=1 Tax=Lunatimonas lonarensis TaxID=1232681 RepID=R7ZN40_9BACT|nr:Rieske 2Fe-2S domain-containing protein [Lunatimonas lonarensis]EON75520.1 biphenyl dioxygenase [Lunatimonas lonarensis]